MSTGVILLTRHGAAGDRAEWEGPDALRPLTPKGRRQADGLVELLGAHAIAAIVSSPYVRCVQTLEPLAVALRVQLADADWLAEGAQPGAAFDRLLGLAPSGVVACSHGDVIGGIVELVAREGVDIGSAPRLQKGSTWRFEVSAGRPAAASYLPPPV